jgi:hypothetical protein
VAVVAEIIAAVCLCTAEEMMITDDEISENNLPATTETIGPWCAAAEEIAALSSSFRPQRQLWLTRNRRSDLMRDSAVMSCGAEEGLNCRIRVRKELK